MDDHLLIIIGIVVVFVLGAAGAAHLHWVYAIRAVYDEHELQARLDDFNQRGEAVDLEKIELSLPFAERVIYPVARKLGEIAIKFTPQNALQSTARKLELAGNPGRLDPTMFLSLQFIVALFFGGLLILVFTSGVILPVGTAITYSSWVGFVIGFLLSATMANQQN